MTAYLVIGCGFGDEGKGAVVDAITRAVDATLVVRTGGCQAAHHVTADGRSHCFAQFGSGTLAGARTHLAASMFVDPLALATEANHLVTLGIGDPLARLTIDPLAPVITVYHRALNRLREVLRGSDRHGSCGVGISELAADIASGHPALTAFDVLFGADAEDQVQAIRERLAGRVAQLWKEAATCGERRIDWSVAGIVLGSFSESPRAWLTRVRNALTQIYPYQMRRDAPFALRNLIVEHSQGILLDERYGFPPYHTWLDCTARPGERALAAMGFTGEVCRIGVLRSFFTRHGPGPFPTEDPSLASLVADDHNQHNAWQGAFRVGHFDAVLAKYAVECAGRVDMLALTHLDKAMEWGATRPWLMCTAYRQPNAGEVRRLMPAATFAEQPELTAFLDRVTTRTDSWKPYVEGYTSVDSFVAAVERHLGVPVGIQSFGPTASMKTFTPAFRQARTLSA